MNPFKRAQIAYLKVDKDFTKVFSKYADFADIFLLKLAVELSKYLRINNHAIKFADKYLPYNPIYSLGLVKLETWKTCIENNLVNDFIRPFKFPARAPIFFDKKPDRSLELYINYRGLNNLIIKNCYLLP